jgi:sulfotransferase
VERGIHFISGLPRAGSTLLAALLRQNPVLHADITSPSGALVTGMLRGISQGNESALMIDDAQRESLLRGVFDNYYQALHPIKTVFDTNRAGRPGRRCWRHSTRRRRLSVACARFPGVSTASKV